MTEFMSSPYPIELSTASTWFDAQTTPAATSVAMPAMMAKFFPVSFMCTPNKKTARQWAAITTTGDCQSIPNPIVVRVHNKCDEHHIYSFVQ